MVGPVMQVYSLAIVMGYQFLNCGVDEPDTVNFSVGKAQAGQVADRTGYNFSPGKIRAKCHFSEVN